MVEGIVVSPTTCKGRVTKPEDLKVLTNRTPIYIMMEVISQTPKKVESDNIPTGPDVTSCLNPMLEEAPGTLVARMDFDAL